MLFKEKKLESQLSETPKLLQDIAKEFDRLSAELGIEAMVTRVSDSFPGESGVHPAKRAVDFRDEHEGKRLYTSEQAAQIVASLNKKYPRDDGKMTCIHHSFRGGPEHFHLQVKKGA